jgi:glc operon protein GlcG
MAQIHWLERQEARQLLDRVRTLAEQDGGLAITIGVSGVDGIPLVLERMDSAQPLGVNVVLAKLRTAVIGRKDTIARSGKGIEPSDFNEPLFTTLGGGVVLSRDGKVVGALAVSGRAPEDDHALADRVRREFEFA